MTRLEWFDADKILVAGYAGGETASDSQRVSGPLAVAIEGEGSDIIIQGSKSELLRFATDIIEATLIAEARAKDREARMAAPQCGDIANFENLKMASFRMTLTPEQFAAVNGGNINGYSIGEQDLEDVVAPNLRQAALTGNGKVGKYTIAELEAMPMDQYLDACADILGIDPEPERPEG